MDGDPSVWYSFNMAKPHKTSLAACGEHYVASYLSGMGLVVALTRGGAPATDIIVTSQSGGRSVSLQVKSGGPYSHTVSKRNPKNNQWTWRVGASASEKPSEYHWYAFVFIGDWPRENRPPNPEVFFVSSGFVKKTVAENPDSQRDWFWMSEETAADYSGLAGFRKLVAALATNEFEDTTRS